MLPSDTDELRCVLQNLHERSSLPEPDVLAEILDAALSTLSDENPAIRPRDHLGRPGGLLLLNPDITTVLVPDLHARTGYIAGLMDMVINGESVLDSLSAGRLQVLCVGDGFHSEARAARRWKAAWREYQTGFRVHRAMDEEMREGLALMAMVMLLKISVPDRFHFLKGNHENVANVEENGNRPFGKYAMEGQMVRDWFLMFLGSDMLDRWAQFENNLPLLAVGDRFLVSHAEPRRSYSREEMIEYRGNDELIFDFTWTGNDESEEGSVAEMLDIYLGPDAPGALYFGGHRPVKKLYHTRAGGRYVQIHNPDREVVAILESGRYPDPQRDIRVLGGEQL